MRVFLLLMAFAFASVASAASGAKRSKASSGESGREAPATAEIDGHADDLRGQLADLFAGTATDWDTFSARARILEEKKPEAFGQLQEGAIDFFIDRFGVYQDHAETLSPVDRHVLSNLWQTFPGFLDLPLYRRLADRPSQREMAELLEAYEAALTDETLAKKFPIFDAHFHYYPIDPDRNLRCSPEAVIRILRRYNVVGALASGVPDNAVETLHRLAPDLIAPEIMPNKSTFAHDHEHSDLYDWHQKADIVPMVRRWIASELPLVGIGEIHAAESGKGLTSPSFKELAQLAGDKLILHLHLDVKDISKAIGYVFKLNKDARVLLAHGGLRGMDAPTPSPTAEEIGHLLEKHPNLHIDLSAREDLWSGGQLEKDWKKLLIKHHDRVLLGSDPYLRYRWEFYGALLYRMRRWLATLPAEVAADIAYRNGLRLFKKAGA